MHLAFIQMGQGDCTILTTPSGRVVLIDCGSDASETTDDLFRRRVVDQLTNERFLKNAKDIDVVILTHPDSDHCNKFSGFLPVDTVIYGVYHSAARTDYAAGKASSWLLSHTKDPLFIKAVTHRPGSGGKPVTTINDVPIPPADDATKVDRLVDGAIRVLDEANCTVDILASNVDTTPYEDHSNERNRGSVVTLITAFGKKLLICGDATINTEKYLLDTHGPKLADLHVVQAPHHGSINTSSSAAFVTKTNPEKVVISAGKQVVKDHLPSEATIQRYVTKQEASKRTAIARHEIFFWRPAYQGSYITASAWYTAPTYVTGSWETVLMTIDENT